MAGLEPLDEEHLIIAELKAQEWKALGTPSTPIHQMTAMLAEIRKKRRLLKSDITDEDLATVFRLIRMELSRHETFPVFEQTLGIAFRQTESEVSTLGAALQAKARRKLQTGTVLESIDPSINDEIKQRIEKEAEDVGKLASMVAEAQFHQDRLIDFGNTVEQLISETNGGLHNPLVDARGLRKTNPKTLLFLENLTKIWLEHVDPELGLPIRSKDETNPYIRYLMHGLLFFGPLELSALQLNSLARQHFKPALSSA